MRYTGIAVPLIEGRRTGKNFSVWTFAASEAQAGRFLRTRYPYPMFVIENVHEDPEKDTEKMDTSFAQSLSGNIQRELGEGSIRRAEELAKQDAETAARFQQCKCESYGDPKLVKSNMSRALNAIFYLYGNTKELPRVDWKEFQRGYEEELEHGCRRKSTNITCDDPVATAKIVLAHLIEDGQYYTRLNLGKEIK